MSLKFALLVAVIFAATFDVSYVVFGRIKAERDAAIARAFCVDEAQIRRLIGGAGALLTIGGDLAGAAGTAFVAIGKTPPASVDHYLLLQNQQGRPGPVFPVEKDGKACTAFVIDAAGRRALEAALASP